MIISETDNAFIVHKCHRCQSTNIVRNGHNRLGQEQYHCLDCGCYRVLHPRRKQSNPDKPKALKATLERCSLRGVARIFRVGRNTLMLWIQELCQQLPSLTQTLLPAQPTDLLELDEVWSFVGKRHQKRWIWTALCRRTRQIVAYVIGDRSEETCQKLWSQIPEAYRHCFCFSDFWRAYQAVLPIDQHQAVGKGSGETSHMERWYNTLRQRVARFTRRTLAFSKTDTNHQLFFNWFVIEHNLKMASSLT